VYDLQTHFRKFLPDVVTLPQCFKNGGYHTQGLSKIYHPGLDDPASWSVPHWAPRGPAYMKPESRAQQRTRAQQVRAQGARSVDQVLERDPRTGLALRVRSAPARLKGPSWEDPDVADNALNDGKTADRAIAVLRDLKSKPFFLATGFLRPHLPFVAPKKYFDLYPKSKISPADNPFPPRDCPEIALSSWGELRSYTDIPRLGALDESKSRDLIRAYYAATSYTDAQIGRVLNELDRLGLREKTIVVLWGDHGWQLGEHGQWCKHTNFEEATHAPLIVSAPGQKNAGAKTEALVEFVDVYPSLCDLAGLSAPAGLEGTSFKPVMTDPKRSWKKAAFSQYPRAGGVMGYSMRTDRYRYTEWAGADKKLVGVELYDYTDDPKGNANVAASPDTKALAASLSEQLHEGWKGALPGRP
jgi:arylsulfatase A-like enzyme